MTAFKNIILIGFMGCGKTTIGKRISDTLKMNFIDTDSLIQKNIGMSISQIFEEYGESEFRNIETKTCIELSDSFGNVIATGGGIIKNQKNVDALKKSGVFVYLKATPEFVYKNLKDDNSRPLLNVDDKLSKIRELMFQRVSSYEKYSDLTIDISEYSIENAVNIIIEDLKGLGML